MATTFDEFVESIIHLGLMDAEEVRTFLASQPEDRQPHTAEDLARELYHLGKLTKFQANAIYQKKTRGLVAGNYVVPDRLGKGGMGTVYKAQHKRMKRIVALKMLPSSATKSPEAVKRFQREVEAAAKLSHPNIVTAYDADEDKGVHFLVMEYVEGPDQDRMQDYFRPDDWNDLDVTALGNNVTCRVNGYQTAELSNCTTRQNEAVILQLFGIGDTEVRFRDIRLRSWP